MTIIHGPLATTLAEFPLEIQSHPENGRGFYATQAIAAGTEVFIADPIATVVSEDWISNVCMWCFRFDDSKRWKFKAIETRNNKNGDALCKDVFCSQDCKDRMIHQQNNNNEEGKKVWALVTGALEAISGELARRKRSLQVLSKKQKKAGMPNFNPTSSHHHHHSPAAAAATAADADAGSVVVVSATVEKKKTNGTDSVKIDDGDDVPVLVSSQQQQQQQQQPEDRDQDLFDLEDNDLLDQFIGDTWTRLLKTGFSEPNYIPAPDQLETLKLIVMILAKKEIEDQQQQQQEQKQNKEEQEQTNEESSSEKLNLEFCFSNNNINLGFPSRPHQPNYADLLHMQSNEKNVFRRDYRKKHQLVDGYGTATGGCIWLPKNPDSIPKLIADLPDSTKDTIALFSFLQTALSKSSSSFNPDRQHFRAIYYREVANAFGMWDGPSSSANAIITSSGSITALATSYLDAEQEILGYGIYPTAVYFNHSCRPNISKVREDRRMRFFANRHVEKGEECQISYGSVAEKVAERRERLWNHYFFLCGCRKCIEEEEENKKK